MKIIPGPRTLEISLVELAKMVNLFHSGPIPTAEIALSPGVEAQLASPEPGAVLHLTFSVEVPAVLLAQHFKAEL